MVWLIVYFFFVETQGPTLEELSLIFEDGGVGKMKALGNIEGKRDAFDEDEHRHGELKKDDLAVHVE
jgi:hypothetical protein